jgi:hypothetical protein
MIRSERSEERMRILAAQGSRRAKVSNQANSTLPSDASLCFSRPPAVGRNIEMTRVEVEANLKLRFSLGLWQLKGNLQSHLYSLVV